MEIISLWKIGVFVDVSGIMFVSKGIDVQNVYKDWIRHRSCS